MTPRVLDPSEWSRLRETGAPLGTVVDQLDPAQTQIIVVEDGDQIVGCWAVLRVVHVEGAWVHPDHRKRSAVVRRLMQMMRRVARRWGASSVLTGADCDDIRSLLERRAMKVPFDVYAWPIGEGV